MRFAFLFGTASTLLDGAFWVGAISMLDIKPSGALAVCLLAAAALIGLAGLLVGWVVEGRKQ